MSAIEKDRMAASSSGAFPEPPERASASRFVSAMILISVFLALAAFSARTAASEASEQPAKLGQVLILRENSYGLPIPDTVLSEIVKSLQSNKMSVNDIFVEYLDLNKNRDAEHRSNILALLRHKLSDRQIRLIIAISPGSLEFLTDECRDLFPDAPALTVLMPYMNVTWKGKPRPIIELHSRTDVEGSLRYARDLFPKARRLVVVNGADNRGSIPESRITEALSRLQWNPDVEDTGELTYEEMLRRVASLPENTVALYGAYFHDKTGRSFIPAEVAAILAQKANAPVFGLYDIHVSEGLIGGSVMSNVEIGKLAGAAAFEYLQGKIAPPKEKTVIEVPFLPLFNWPQITLRRCNPSRLPENSVFLSRPPSLWRQHRAVLVSTALVFLLMITMILGLLFQNRRRERAERGLQEERQRLAGIIKGTNVGTWEWNVQSGRIVINARWAEIVGYDLDEISPTSIDEWRRLTHPEDLQESLKLLEQHFRGEIDYYEIEARMAHKDGSWIWVLDRGKVTEWTADGKPLLMMGTHQDITSRKEAEEALRSSEEKFALAFRTSPYAITITRASDGKIMEVNDAFASVSGFTRQEALEGTSLGLSLWADEADRDRIVNALLNGKRVTGEEHRFRKKNGEIITCLFSAEMIRLNNEPCILSSINDITERKLAEQEREKLQEQFIQAQKMESVGRLAGGVAHDFNNMLSIILGYTKMAMDELSPSSSTYADLNEVRKAAERSANLTRQLLAFARKQTAVPKPLDINETITGMIKMLERIIGENIVLSWRPGADVWKLWMDPSQIDQILFNLCVNARDAIDGVGRIAISTDNVVFDEADAPDHPGFAPGEYVLLVVEDNGCGMDKQTLSSIFEPFFTTKEPGQGTGLGLSTVYGIIRQNNGFVNVYSEPGLGSTFRIYLPRSRRESEQEPKQEGPEPVASAKETILVVEDDPSVLRMTTRMLELQGYTVLAAGAPSAAIALAASHAGEIHLLMTDVVMPEMNGLELSKALLRDRPNLKQLFVSGYTADIIARHGVLDKGVHFIQKPLSNRALASKIQEALGQGRR